MLIWIKDHPGWARNGPPCARSLGSIILAGVGLCERGLRRGPWREVTRAPTRLSRAW